MINSARAIPTHNGLIGKVRAQLASGQRIDRATKAELERRLAEFANRWPEMVLPKLSSWVIAHESARSPKARAPRRAKQAAMHV